MPHKKYAIIAVNLLTIILLSGLPLSAQAENCTEAPIGGQVYSLINAGSGLALDVYGNRIGNGINLIQWPYKASSNQQFLFHDLNNGYWSIMAKHSGQVLSVAAKALVDGGNILQWNYNGGSNQQWQLKRSESGLYTVIARHSGKLMTVSGDTAGGRVFQQSDNSSANQLWHLNPIDENCNITKPTQEPTAIPTTELTEEPTMVSPYPHDT
jgi:pectate lyase